MARAADVRLYILDLGAIEDIERDAIFALSHVKRRRKVK
jgi:hypothetical protein